jgi:cytoskeletal protein RodZ
MRHELDIADVEARTKIRAKYLRALENEEFGVLPGPTTVRSFIRTYAELLGLDPHPLVEEYRSRTEDREEVETQPLPAAPRGNRRERRERRPTPPPRSGRGGPSPLMLIAGTILVVLVALAIIGLIGGEEEGGGNRASQEGDTTQARQQPARKPKRREKPATPDVATLNVAPTVPTYVCVDTGPNTEILFEGTLDSARRFRGKRVRLNLGKTSVKLTANGKGVPLEPSPTPVGYDVTPTRVEELEPGQRPCA